MNLLRLIPDFFDRLGDAAIDRRCLNCGAPLERGQYGVCPDCIQKLNLFNRLLIQTPNNILEKRLLGLTNIKVASALMMYEKGGVSQALIHELKYHGNRNIAITLGHAIGQNILNNPRYGKIDCIIPVPLHKWKKFQRGYNQSEEISRWIGEILNAPVVTDNLVRAHYRLSQTTKSAHGRSKVKNNFCLMNPSFFEGKNILIVDDVFTTGSTIIDCCKAFDSVRHVSICLYTAATPAAGL